MYEKWPVPATLISSINYPWSERSRKVSPAGDSLASRCLVDSGIHVHRLLGNGGAPVEWVVSSLG